MTFRPLWPSFHLELPAGTLSRGPWRRWFGAANPKAFTCDENRWFVDGWHRADDAPILREHLRTTGMGHSDAAKLARAIVNGAA